MAQTKQDVRSSSVNVSNDTIIDPHFTGKDCDVCHIEASEPSQDDLMLKFDGDDVAMCNSCHESENMTCDIHPTGIVPHNDAFVAVPQNLPLFDGKITCRTCHDIYMQCKADSPKQFENILFLRDGHYEKTTDFCFLCHNREQYVKINPHSQIDENGRLLLDKCLYCHKIIPDPETVSSIEEIEFQTDIITLCVSCHGNKGISHPANANHILEPSVNILKTIEESEDKFNVILPLYKGKVFCGTCHNPHESGVIKKKDAAKGSEEEIKLRLDWAYDLCVTCHGDKEDVKEGELEIDLSKKNVFLAPLEETLPSYHKSFLENKCRACHMVTRQSPELPLVSGMCFQAGCHDTSLVGKTFKHNEAQKGNCLLCHNAHGSQYGAHIINYQQILCVACHPLLGKRGDTGSREIQEDFHKYYFALMKKLVPDSETNCMRCHGGDHTSEVYDTGIAPCYECHNFIKKLISGKPNKPKDIHDNFEIKICSECHEPHSSSYPDLLKKDPESYFNTP